MDTRRMTIEVLMLRKNAGNAQKSLDEMKKVSDKCGVTPAEFVEVLLISNFIDIMQESLKAEKTQRVSRLLALVEVLQAIDAVNLDRVLMTYDTIVKTGETYAQQL